MLSLVSLARVSTFTLIISLASCAQAKGSGQAEAATGISRVRGNWEAWEAGQPSAGAIDKARVIAASQQADGCWSDVDYNDQHVSEWRANEHLNRLNALATAGYALRHGAKPDASLDAAGVRALRCWVRKDEHNPNWWWNEIGAPKAVGRAALLLQPKLSADDIARVTAVLERSKWTAWTGQNLVWGVDIQVMRGMLNGDATLVQGAFDRLYKEVRIVPLWEANGKPGEGIEADASFHQHGAQLYSGGYGLSFAVDVGRELVLAWKTPFQASPDIIDVYSRFLLDGEQWMMHPGVFDYIARGREITRPGEAGSAHSSSEFVRVAHALAELPLPRQKELQIFAASLTPGDGRQPLAGNHAFWNSDLIEHKRAGFSTSVRMLSTRSKNEESLNGEGMRSVHLADGVNLLYKTGQEYAGIFPVWNWNMVPGTTAMQWTDAQGVPVTGEAKPIGQLGRNAFAGEVSDGAYGAAAMMLERGPLTANKAWFFFDDVYVALGSKIHVADGVGVPAVPVLTTIEQKRLHGTVEQKMLSDKRLLVAHDGVGYIVGPGTKADVNSTPQTGRWSDIGTGPAATVTMPVFRLSLDHGIRPVNGRYEYTVLPEGGMQAAMKEADSPTVSVLANRDDLQAVTRGDVVMAVFYQAGSLDTPLGKVGVNAPAMLLVRHEGKGVSITASNPLGAAAEVIVTLDGRAATMHLPGGMDAGRSVTQMLTH